MIQCSTLQYLGSHYRMPVKPVEEADEMGVTVANLEGTLKWISYKASYTSEMSNSVSNSCNYDKY